MTIRDLFIQYGDNPPPFRFKHGRGYIYTRIDIFEAQLSRWANVYRTLPGKGEEVTYRTPADRQVILLKDWQKQPVKGSFTFRNGGHLTFFKDDEEYYRGVYKDEAGVLYSNQYLDDCLPELLSTLFSQVN